MDSKATGFPGAPTRSRKHRRAEPVYRGGGGLLAFASALDGSDSLCGAPAPLGPGLASPSSPAAWRSTRGLCRARSRRPHRPRRPSGGQNQKWPPSGQNGYLTPAVSGIPTASERGAESEVAPKWAKWLPHPCRIGDPHRFRAGGRIRSGPQVGKVVR